MVFKLIPLPTDNISNSQLDLLNNFTQLDTSFGVNHYKFSDVSGNTGKHAFVEMPAQSLPTGLGANEITLYAQLVSSQAELFLTRGNSGIAIQMTAGLNTSVPNADANGATFLPGGLILQWGTAALPGTGTTSFNVKTTNIFNMQATLIGNSASSNTISIIATAPGSPGSFTWHFTGSSSYTSFFWIAIGN